TKSVRIAMPLLTKFFMKSSALSLLSGLRKYGSSLLVVVKDEQSVLVSFGAFGDKHFAVGFKSLLDLVTEKWIKE
ncbi:MAG: hypothetical protein JRN15_14040, partial [Nitrososphaerota archaeon]|nr:hypothetical protein [Nitrososphaerota archaeon]